MNSPGFVSKKKKERQTDREKERQVKRENKILKAEFKKADRHTFLEEVVARSMDGAHWHCFSRKSSLSGNIFEANRDSIEH